MSLNFEFMVSLRYLRAKDKQFLCSVITLFSLMGITLGVATLIVVMSVMNGFSDKLLTNILGMNGHITVYFDPNINTHYQQVTDSIRAIPEVIEAIPITEDQVMIKKGKNSVAGAIVKGISLNDLKQKKIVTNNIVAGSLDEFNNGIIIGSRLAENLGVSYGSKITLISPESFSTVLGRIPRMKTYRIVGIFDVGMYEYDNILIYMPIQSSQLFFNYGNNIKNIEIFLQNVNQSLIIAQKIEKITKMTAEDWQAQQSHYFNALKIESNVMFFILTLIIIVATFNIVSSLSILVENKKQSIAIMRTIGVTRGGIMRIFCTCGLFIGVLGTTLGCTLGITFALNIEKIKIFLENLTNNQLFDPVIYFFNTLPSILLVEDVVKVSSLSILLSFLATIFPAYTAASQDPADILRYE